MMNMQRLCDFQLLAAHSKITRTYFSTAKIPDDTYLTRPSAHVCVCIRNESALAFYCHWTGKRVEMEQMQMVVTVGNKTTVVLLEPEEIL